jgi:hypothetical protein
VVVSIQPVSTLLAASVSTTFDVQVTPLGDGAFTCTVTIDNDDPNESPYMFNMLGAGVSPADGGGEDEGCAASPRAAGSTVVGALAMLLLFRRRRARAVPQLSPPGGRG